MVKKKVPRSVERNRDIQKQDVKTSKDAVTQQQVNKQNITIKIGTDVLQKVKKKKKKRKTGPSKKTQIINQIKLALDRLQQLKKDAEEKKVKIPAELGKLPIDADNMKTIPQLTQLLNTLNDRNNRIAELISKGGESTGNVFNEGVFGSGGTFPASYRLPNPFQQQAPVVIGGQGQTIVQPQPAPQPSKPPTDPNTRTIVPTTGTAKANKEQEEIMDKIKEMKKDIQARLKQQLKAGKITEDEYKDKIAKAQLTATLKERQIIQTIMGPKANKEYSEIILKINDYRKILLDYKKSKITGTQEQDLKDRAYEASTLIQEFKKNYPELIAEHPELFSFREQLDFLAINPVRQIAENTGQPITETGIEEGEMTAFNAQLYEVNQNAQELQSDFDRMKAQDTLSPSEIKQLQKQAKAIDSKMKELKQKAESGTNQSISLNYQKAENKKMLAKVKSTINAVLSLALPTPVKVGVDQGIQKAVWRLLAYLAGVFVLGSEYDKSTFNADLDKINAMGLKQDKMFKRMPDNSSQQKSNVSSFLENYLSVNDGFSRDFEGKDYKIGKGGGARRMIQPTANLSTRGRIGNELPEIPDMMF